jgi:hypothetical protein
MKTLLLSSFLSLFILSGCDKMDSNKAAPDEKSLVTSLEPPPSPPSSIAGNADNAPMEELKKGETGKEENTVSESTGTVQSVKIPEKIIKTGNLNISVDNYKTARSAVEKIVNAGGAYISGENEQNSSYSISNEIVIRVLNKNFDSLLNGLSGIGKEVNSKNISTEDVTAQFVDIQARLKTKKEVERRYLELLQKAVKISDILEIEEKARVLREEIESWEGQLKFLSDKVNYSTINLTIHQEFEYQPSDRPGFFNRLGNAFSGGWNGFITLLIGLVYAWPLLIVAAVLAYFIVKAIRRERKK